MQWTEPKLLIADDDRDFRESLGEVFARRGYATRFAADGCEAVEIVQSSGELHLMLMDFNMPRLTGLEALQEIRKSSKCDLPCVLMSAQLDDSIVRQAQQLNISGVLSKPFKLRDVTAIVEDILRTCYGWSI